MAEAMCVTSIGSKYKALACNTSGIDAALAASLFHFKEMDIMDLKRFLKTKNIHVRL
mgnify:CR=1 FL=1